jgi:hypothetical protein
MSEIVESSSSSSSEAIKAFRVLWGKGGRDEVIGVSIKD